MKKRYAIAGAALGAAALLPITGRRRFHSRVSAEVRQLFSDATGSVGADQLNRRWEQLPDPVRRYFRYSTRDGAIRTARLKHAGSFRTSPGSPWLPIEGEQYFSVFRPGFVWNARVWPMSLLWIEARDMLLDGHGHMLVKGLSSIPLASAGGPEIDQGARLRWLGECAWFPYGFVADDVEWEPIDARFARATLRQDGLPVTAVFEIDEQGTLVGIRAERYRSVGAGGAELTPWWGAYRDYQEVNGFRVPTSLEGGWDLDGTPFAYARFNVLTLDYNARVRF